MAEQSNPSSSSSSSSSSSTAAAGEEDEDKDARPLVSYPKVLPDSCLVRNPRVVPPTKKLPVPSQEEVEEGGGRGEAEAPQPRGTKRLRKNRPKALDKIHPSDDDEEEEEDENLPLFSFGTRAYSPQLTPKFGSFSGEGGEERRE
ncbi:hypothetical protein MLD38_030987 [Melastoma candidum]|uniref:Uncharacterized protein n=1 Tax=Melastoma candidum TaxID=119954 RepID=A0ACB9MNW3_9MYRT|nr:hypothetical protein MLD38_030987 [Melastoma candidum]